MAPKVGWLTSFTNNISQMYQCHKAYQKMAPKPLKSFEGVQILAGAATNLNSDMGAAAVSPLGALLPTTAAGRQPAHVNGDDSPGSKCPSLRRKKADRLARVGTRRGDELAP